MNPELTQTHAEIIKVILGYSFVAFFIATGIITLLALIGFIKIVERKYLNRLFYAMISEIVVIGLGSISGLLSLDTRKPVAQAESSISKKNAIIAEKTAELKTIEKRKDEEFAGAIHALMPLATETISKRPDLAKALNGNEKNAIRLGDSKSYLASRAATRRPSEAIR